MALDPAKMTHKELRVTLLQVMLGAEEAEAALRAELDAERLANARLRAELRVTTERVAQFEAVVVELREEIRVLKGGSGRKNSTNSSMPPSMDVPEERAKRSQKRSLRKPSGKKPGGQAGHAGSRLELVDVPDEVVVHEPSACSGCGNELRDAFGRVVSKHQVTDIPEVVRVRVVEHQVVEKECSCGVVVAGSLPYGVSDAEASYGPNVTHTVAYLSAVQHVPVSRCQEIVSEMFGLHVSTGWIDTVLTRMAARLSPSLGAIKTHVQADPVVHFDETAVRVAGKDQWVHSACNECVTLLHTGPGRGKDGIEAGGVWDAFTGTAVHDEYSAYFTYELVEGRGICNAHRLRDLNAAIERGDVWAEKMRDVMLQIKQAVDAAKAAGKIRLGKRQHQKFVDKYRAIVAEAELEHPGRISKKTGGRCKQTESRNLIIRFRDREAETLKFATDFRVPFTNNIAEQSVRMLKVNQKVSGGRRSSSGLQRLVAIRSVIQTARKQGLNAKQALRDALTTPGYVLPIQACHAR